MYAFVALGLPDGMIGTAWPAMRRSFDAPLADLGIVLLVGTLGALASSLIVGLLLKRFGFRTSLITGALAGALGAVGIAVAPAFWALVVAGVAIGVAAGLIDGSVNTSVALARRNRLLNLLHGCYGVGTTIGPLVVTAALLSGSWRASYIVALAVEILLAAGWWWVGRRRAPATPTPAVTGQDVTYQETTGLVEAPAASRRLAPAASVSPSRLRVVFAVAIGLIVFMLYVGVEASAGQWEPSFDRGLLHMGAGATGVATFGFWGALTLGRFVLALPRRQLSPVGIVRWGCVAAVAGAVLVWWRPGTVVPLLGLVLIGGAFAGVFPALMVLTPRRVGEELSAHVIGWQVGAAGIGGSILSAVFGWIFQDHGLGEFGPALTVTSLVLLVGVLALERLPDLVPVQKP
ncbi:MAG TPA: MFS transporter [Acidimicrobiales bacterium]|nr:MFS transporter [Acidimicrobiales bacterium]